MKKHKKGLSLKKVMKTVKKVSKLVSIKKGKSKRANQLFVPRIRTRI